MYDDIKLNQDNYESGGFRDYLAFGFASVGEYLFLLCHVLEVCACYLLKIPCIFCNETTSFFCVVLG